MAIKRSRFPNHLIVLGNSKYFFRKVEVTNDLWKVVRSFDCDGVAKVYINSVGMFGFKFYDSSDFASIDILRFEEQGCIPDEVMKNDDDIHNLQEKRMLFVNFVLASFFGRVSVKQNRTLDGAIYNGQDKLTSFSEGKDKLIIQWTEELDKAIGEKIKEFNIGNCKHYILNDDDIDDAISYIQKLITRQNDFNYADMQSCIVMNYQAAILHNQQHATASLALNFSVIESLVKEVIMTCGMVIDCEVKSFESNQSKIKKMTKKKLYEIKMYEAIKMLYKAELISEYLYQRLEYARKKRNSLMHKGETISPKDSGDCQTLVRDLWALLIDTPFELNTAWSYKR
ncbi:MAG: hypothetical protein ACPHLK_05690 [Gammaproteobacteria bacterium]|jgi:hypothetical protein